MSMITLFCEIDDFFLALMKHQARIPPTAGGTA